MSQYTVIRKHLWPLDWQPKPLNKEQAKKFNTQPGTLAHFEGDLVYILDVARLERV